jgi:putative N6-adenine-specific DNA methylase
MKWPGDETLIATCGGGAEEALEAEIASFGLVPISRGNGMVRFRGGGPEMIRSNLTLRTASRVLIPVAEGDVRSFDDLYKLAGTVRWDSLVPARLTIAVSAVSRDRRLADTRLAALKVKDAVVDRQRGGGAKTGRARSSVDRRNPDVPIAVFIADGRATISLDSSGAPLHMRGYRREGGEAPLRETVAAAMLHYAGWEPSVPLLDPFCGSGTIVIEAALRAANIPPCAIRERYAFERWPWIGSGPVDAGRARARGGAAGDDVAPDEITTTIVARDSDRAMIETAKRNADRAGVASLIRFEHADALEAGPPCSPGLIVTNPPYGERLELKEEDAFYAAYGDRLKQSFAGWTAAILSANRDAMKSIGLRVSSRKQLWNGGLDARLYTIALYASRRE